MGFKARMSVFRLDFEGTDLEGLEMKVRSVTVEEFDALLDEGVAAVEGLEQEKEDAASDMRKVNTNVRDKFLENLVSWNLTDDEDLPIPTTLEGVRKLDAHFLARLIFEWQRAISSVPTGSPRKSANGRKPAPSLGLQEASRNLGSW